MKIDSDTEDDADNNENHDDHNIYYIVTYPQVN